MCVITRSSKHIFKKDGRSMSEKSVSVDLSGNFINGMENYEMDKFDQIMSDENVAYSFPSSWVSRFP